MAHLGARAFDEISGEIVQTTSFSLRNSHIKGYAGTYCRLIKPTSEQGKSQLFLSGERRFITQQDYFTKIPGSPVAYWVAPQVFELMDKERLNDFFVSAGRFKSCNDERYLRFWWEPTSCNINWHCYCKGGDGRKYVGNELRLLNWTRDSQDYYKTNGGVGNRKYWESEGITWATITTSTPSFRIKPETYFWSSSAPTIFKNKELSIRAVLAYLNSKPAEYLLGIFNPTASLTVADVLKLPYRKEWENPHCIELCGVNEKNCRMDWNSFEISNGFTTHPLVRHVGSIEIAYEQWKSECNERFEIQKKNEEEINKYFIDIFGLGDELIPEVVDTDITVRKADLQREIKSFISYAIGCIFGRYSLDTPGLVYAGNTWNDRDYSTFIPDSDNCIPITDEQYFEDDIVGCFVEFVRAVYGTDMLETNLSFIANVLGNKGNSSREVIRNYFLNDFIKDHNKIYQKHPIYWLFDSGKQNGFKALVYMHRWNADTIGNLRVEYLHCIQRVYEKEIARMQDIIDNSRDNREISQATKRREKLIKQLKEARDYDAKIAHAALSRVEIDLDDGVKVNYEKVQKGPDGKSLGILAKI